MLKEIQLTQGQIALVDDTDYEYLNQFKWHAHKEANTFYAQRNTSLNGIQKIVKMHRIIMHTPDNLDIDHIDHNGLNNQKINLRNCSHAQNMTNRKSYGSSKYLGVCIHRNKWQADIRYDNKRHYLGLFKTETEAALAYDKKAKEVHGEFANLNFKL